MRCVPKMNHNLHCGSFSSLLLFFPHPTEPLPQDDDNDASSSSNDDGDGSTCCSCNNDNDRGSSNDDDGNSSSSSDDDDDGSSCCGGDGCCCLEPDGFHNGGGEMGWKTVKRVRQWLHGFDNGQMRKWRGNNKKER